MTRQFRSYLFFTLAAVLHVLPGCNSMPTTGKSIQGAPDGAVEVMMISSAGQIELQEAEFLKVVDRKDPKLVLVDFWAPWCGPCRQLTPIIEKIKNEWGDKLEVVRVNVDDNQAIAAHLQVNAIPDVRIYSGGVQVGDFVGLMPQDEIEALLRSLE
jgi:thioredoxin